MYIILYMPNLTLLNQQCAKEQFARQNALPIEPRNA